MVFAYNIHPNIYAVCPRYMHRNTVRNKYIPLIVHATESVPNETNNQSINRSKYISIIIYVYVCVYKKIYAQNSTF